MSAIGPGDWVECIDAGRGTVFALGGVYRVRRIVEGDIGACGLCGRRHGGLLFCGIPDPTTLSAWSLCAFKPIYRPKADLIESLLTKAPEPEPA